MAEVMQSIASIFSRPSALWSFNALDKDENVPIKIENDTKEYEDVVMETGDDSDSDIEIVGFTQGITATQANTAPRANTISRSSTIPKPSTTPQANTNPRVNTVPQKRQSENDWRPSSTPSDTKANERNGRKRGESPVNLSVNQSPKKKAKTDVNGEKKAASAFSGRYAVPSRPPPRPSPATSQSTPPNSRKTPLLGGTLDFAGSFHGMNTARPRGMSQSDHNAAKSKVAQPSSSADPSVQNRGAISTARMKIPFNDDDSDEDFRETPELIPRAGAARSLFNRMWSQPQPSAADAMVKHSTAADKARNHVKAIHDQARRNNALNPGSISYQPFKAKSTSQRPTNNTGTDRMKADSNLDASNDYTPFMSGLEKPGSSMSAFTRFADSKPDSKASDTGMEHPRMTTSDSTRISDLPRDSNPVEANAVDQQLQRQQGSRKKQEEIMARISKGTAPSGIHDTGRNMLDSNLKEHSNSINMVESTDPVTAESKPSSAPDHLEKRRKAEEATNARKQADLRRETEADQRAQEKSETERLQWERQKRLAATHRDNEKRRQIAAQEEAYIFSERDKALSKLEHVKKPKESSNAIKQTGQGSSSSFGALLKEVSVRPETVQGLTPSDTKLQGTANQEPTKHETSPTHFQVRGTEESTLATRDSEQQTNTARDHRIQHMKVRNEKMQLAEKEREQREQLEESEFKNSNEPSLLTTSRFQPLPTGPVSLNSIAGQRLVAESNIDIQTNSADARSGARTPDRNQKKKVGNITADDVRLVGWRYKGMTFREINQLFQETDQRKRSDDTVRRRYNLVRKAVKDAAISEALQDRLFSGSEDAREEVNRKINDIPSSANNTATSTQLKSNTGSLAVRSRPSTHLSLKNNSQSILSPESSFSSRTMSASPTLPDSEEQDDLPARPSTGGKTMNEEAFKHYLEAAMGEWEKDVEESEARATREPSPFTDDDYATFTYQVERRELCQDAIEDGFNIDDELWVKCSRDFDTVLAANIAAYKQLFRTPQGLVPGVDFSGARQHNVTVNEGMEFHELKGSDGGIRQVRVARFMQTYRKGVLPQSKDGWTPRTVFFVKQRTVTTSKDEKEGEEEDELFGETVNRNVIREIKVDVENEAYTILDLANETAIKKFVKMAFTPQSGNLTLRQMEIQQEEARLLKELEEDEDGLFHEHAEDDDGDQLDIWVEEGDLKGARNLD